MLIGDGALARILRHAMTFAPEGEGESEPLSYDAQIQADVDAAVKEVEAKAPEEVAPDTKGAASDVHSPHANDGRERDAQGRFIAKPIDAARNAQETAGKLPASDGQQTPADPDPAAGKPADQQQAAAPSVANPPTSWTVEAKAQWDALPALIKDAIHKRETEMGAGLAALRDYKDLKPFAEMAAAGGTNLAAALHNYTTIERTLNANPAQGLMEVCKNLGMSKQQAAGVFAQLAQHLGATVSAHQNGGRQGQSDQNDDDPLMEVLQPLIDRRLTPLQQQNELLARQLHEITSANQTAVATSIEQTLAVMVAEPEFRYLPDLEGAICELFQSGMVKQTGNHRADIARAYRMAAAGDDRIAPLLSNARATETDQQRMQREADAAAKAAKASRSITGSAIDGAAPVNGKGKRREGMSYDEDLRADVMRAAGVLN